MHWFWRVTIAATTAYCVGILLYFVHFVLLIVPRVPQGATIIGYWEGLIFRWYLSVPSLLLYSLPIAVYVLLTKRFCPSRPIDETYCRKCGYILRGITEPRCPECGERI